ncbi:MaoC family dehydratase [Amycolatopsis regifaucium]|uniref:Enoyl-CoA hydratase n=1 Tax=Amycolatopsis regifaucium TaxID=546365 RepID=A0A154MG38_9PSEU|nr:MaoC family dehydratase [Amycolatopsis regifaucium]KZB83163.1 enoyl-CoA hydratase [Amycolatopsis regifaucium]OKA03185.1 enoyl-CoA hydratase [Amycolatopsis regifaucium]SFJ48005.1 Acyl dehydratase [Amycolatopsis regifaucium]
MTRVFASADDVRAVLGEEFGPTGWLTVDQARIDAFAEATGDHQWIHTDPELAATGPFGTTIAHGFLTLSLIPHFARELYRLDFGTARINYGLGKVRFPAPVPVGSRLRASATFTELKPGPAGVTVTTRYVVELDGAAKPACVAETLVVVS